MTKINKKSENYSQELAEFIAETARSMQAENIKILDMREYVEYTDFFVICTGDNKMQIRAIADEVIDKFNEEKIKNFNLEGYDNREWILIDAYDVLFHIFDREAREYYKLEKLWSDVPQQIVTDTK